MSIQYSYMKSQKNTKNEHKSIIYHLEERKGSVLPSAFPKSRERFSAYTSKGYSI